MVPSVTRLVRNLVTAALFLFVTASADSPKRIWPVVKHYDQQHLSQIALPIGGIGTGTISLGGRGDWRDWEIMNRPGKGFNPGSPFFAIRIKPKKGNVAVRQITAMAEEVRKFGKNGLFMRGETKFFPPVDKNKDCAKIP